MFAYYHRPGAAPLRMAVLARHEDGTVDLGYEPDGAPVVTRLPASDLTDEGLSFALLEEPPPPPAKPAPKPRRRRSAKQG